jgi:hypothetical protein
MLAWLFVVVASYVLYVIVYYRCFPCNVDPRLAVQRKGVAEMSMRICQIAHAIVTALFAWGYVFGVFSHSTIVFVRAHSTGFLIWDFVYTWYNYSRYKAIETFTEQAAPQSAKMHNSSILNLHHPGGAAFHHVVTLIFMYGLVFDSDIVGSLIFFEGELPIVFLHWLSILSYKDEQRTLLAAVVSNILVVTYFVCRVVLFPLIFVWWVLLPHMVWTSPVHLVFFAFLTMVYAVNVSWFGRLLKDNHDYFPQMYESMISTC